MKRNLKVLSLETIYRGELGENRDVEVTEEERERQEREQLAWRFIRRLLFGDMTDED